MQLLIQFQHSSSFLRYLSVSHNQSLVILPHFYYKGSRSFRLSKYLLSTDDSGENYDAE